MASWVGANLGVYYRVAPTLCIGGDYVLVMLFGIWGVCGCVAGG